MVDKQGNTLQDLVTHVGRYPEEAFLFVREGLSYSAQQAHGPETEAHRTLQHYLSQHDLDWGELVAGYHAGELPESLFSAIEAAGGCDKLDRHVSGRELCWGLRDYALKRWGMMARVVLESWNVFSTADFGHVVFGFINFDMMRRQDEDSIEDFNDVYSFDEAFDEAFQVGRRDAPTDTAGA